MPAVLRSSRYQSLVERRQMLLRREQGDRSAPPRRWPGLVDRDLRIHDQWQGRGTAAGPSKLAGHAQTRGTCVEGEFPSLRERTLLTLGPWRPPRLSLRWPLVGWSRGVIPSAQIGASQIGGPYVRTRDSRRHREDHQGCVRAAAEGALERLRYSNSRDRPAVSGHRSERRSCLHRHAALGWWQRLCTQSRLASPSISRHPAMLQ